MFIKYCLVLLIVVQLLNAVNLGNHCQTPNRQEGECTLLTKCKPLLQILKNRPISFQNIAFLRQSQCGFQENQPIVCCPKNTTSLISTRDSDSTVLNNQSKEDLFSTNECGWEYQEKLLRGKHAGFEDAPWLTLLEYQKSDGSREIHCGGVLINKRYVLTAAHCINGKNIPKDWKLISVRLGEYNLRTDMDCEGSHGFRICIEPAVNIPIEEKIVHENYNPNDTNQYHNIALLRLTQQVHYSDTVRPICLDIDENQVQLKTKKKLVVAGWGKNHTNGFETQTKFKVFTDLKNLSDCEAFNVNLTNSQICAGSGKNRDTCIVDSGGPLLSYEFTNQSEVRTFVVGVASFGPIPCGVEGSPGVYTNVSKYMKWILSKVQP